ncbi:MAG: zinc ribbon domain-containing protein [Ruminococcus sp.]|nr:zinc ribbon domain-containing protein [Ruminococcus sp.]
MKCNICGTENENGLKFCIRCGNSISPQNNSEPFIPRLDPDRVSMPQVGSMPLPPQQNFNMPPPPPMYNQYAQPQIIGYDPNGMPIYAPPPMYNQYAQPQIIGYDPNGMPIYVPPPVYNQYAQPQIIGYDPNGMPIYAPLPMYNQYAQPQIIGYDPNGMPPPPAPQQLQQNNHAMPEIPSLSLPELPEAPENDKVDVSDDFWSFFDGGESPKNKDFQPADDFFGKSELNADSVKKSNKKQNTYMNDLPVVDAEKLEKHDPAKFSRMYMKNTDDVNSNDLKAGVRRKSDNATMGATKKVDAGRLSVKLKIKSRIAMNSAKEANADDLETYVPKHKEALMPQADKAVEAMPKRINPYESELDAIELPEYMKAKKKKREEIAEIPSLPKVK